MFADLLKRLTQPNPVPLPDNDARLALSALLVRVARADGHFDADERGLILKIAQTRFDLTAAAAEDLLKNAEILESEAPDTVRFTRAIKDAVPFEDRTAIIESLWQVVLADGVRDDAEDSLLRMVANLLGINDRDSALARQRVENRGKTP
ncbi:MAG: TerB family tellurite resistance protein [Thalassovita sp.]